MSDFKQLTLDVEEFFNEEDCSVGVYAVWKINDSVVNEFEDAFEGVEVVSYSDESLEFKMKDKAFKVELKQYYDDAKWVLLQ